MTNLNHPRIIESDPLVEAELDAAISRHFGPRRHTRDFGDTIPVQPMWHHRRGGLAACHHDCHQGHQPCSTPDACRLPEKAAGARVGALILLLSAVFVVGSIAAAIAWWPA